MASGASGSKRNKWLRVQLIDEENRRRFRTASGGRENLPQLGHVGHDGVDPDEAAAGFVGDGFRDAGFPTSRWSVKQQRTETILRDQSRQEAAGLQHVFLPDDLGQPPGPHPGGQRLMRARPFLAEPKGRRRRLLGEEFGLIGSGHFHGQSPRKNANEKAFQNLRGMRGFDA